MTIATSDIVFNKSEFVTDTAVNGGRKGQTSVVSGSKHNLFPRVTKAERTAGVTRYRKEYWCNENASDEVAYDVMQYLEFPSNGGDRFAIGEGTQIDTQGDFSTLAIIWYGVGQLNTLLAGAETEVVLDMESNDMEFPNGGKLHLADKFKTGQTIDSDVDIGDSVTFSASTWSKIAATDDIIYPNGLYVGSNAVMTNETGVTTEEWIDIKDYLYTAEDIGDGDGTDTNPALTTLTYNTNGICGQTGLLPVVTTVCGSTTRTVTVAADGSCSGYCDAGQLNMTNGVWTTDINWTTAPDNGEDITCTYREKCYSYSGNTVTVYLDAQVANAYAVVNTYGAGCIRNSDVQPTSASWSESSTAGTYDESTYPLTFYNDGTERDTWTITFTSATAFTCSGASEGSVGTGSIAVDFSPTNANTGQPYFTLDKDGWGGTWASGDTITFVTNPAAVPIWWREIVPAATAAVTDNLCVLGYYSE